MWEDRGGIHWWRSRDDCGRPLGRSDASGTGRVGAWRAAGPGIQSRHPADPFGLGVISATDPTAPSARPTCGWIRSRRPRADRDGRRAIVPGDLDSSELYRRITAEDESERMPPVKSGKSLSAAEIERIGRWITEGAKWQPHWAFIAPKSPPVPHVPAPGLGPKPDRCVHPRPPRKRGAGAGLRGRAGHLDPARHTRPDRIAPHPRRDLGVRER